MDKPYLLGEIMGKPYRSRTRKYRQLIRRSNKAVIEAIRRLEDEQREYKEYIESWIHDVKLPITAHTVHLQKPDRSCGKGSGAENRARALREWTIWWNPHLFYARSDSVYQDYLIRETDLQAVIDQTIARNKAYLIANRMMIEASCSCGSVFCDEKWLQFILGTDSRQCGKVQKRARAEARIPDHWKRYKKRCAPCP